MEIKLLFLVLIYSYFYLQISGQKMFVARETTFVLNVGRDMLMTRICGNIKNTFVAEILDFVVLIVKLKPNTGQISTLMCDQYIQK